LSDDVTEADDVVSILKRAYRQAQRANNPRLGNGYGVGTGLLNTVGTNQLLRVIYLLLLFAVLSMLCLRKVSLTSGLMVHGGAIRTLLESSGKVSSLTIRISVVRMFHTTSVAQIILSIS
jgi:hypothetical protein